MDILKWIITPLCGGIIGYLTNWLAIKMLFRPYEEIRLFNIRLPFTPGLIPKERKALAKKVAETLSESVLTPEVLNKSLNSPETLNKITVMVNGTVDSLTECSATVSEILGEGNIEKILEQLKSEKVQTFIKDKFPSVIEYGKNILYYNEEINSKLRELVKQIARENFGRLVGIFVNYDNIYDNIKKALFEYLEEPENQLILINHFTIFLNNFIEKDKSFFMDKKIVDLAAMIPPGLLVSMKSKMTDIIKYGIEKGGVTLANSLDLSGAVEDKINGFDLPTAEKIIISVTKKQLQMITVLGGVLGFVIGFIPLILGIFFK